MMRRQLTNCVILALEFQGSGAIGVTDFGNF